MRVKISSMNQFLTQKVKKEVIKNMSSLYNLLTEEDRTLLLSYINNVGNGNLNEATLPTFLSSWNEEKEELHPLFNNSLILSKEITYNLPEVETKKRISEIIDTFWYSFFRPLSEKTCASYARDPNYIYYCDAVNNLFTTKNIVNKIYNNPDLRKPIDFPTPQGNRIRISNGVKTMRVIGKLARAWGYEATYETFRAAISRCFNPELQTATLCLSIHPLDFITMSDNNSDWKSCMSWMNDGEYKQGTLEMLSSSYCVVAYLADGKEKLQWYDYKTHPSFSWNSKKWRQLLFVHPAFIVGNRNYPNDIPEVEELAMKWLRELAETANFSHYRNERVKLTNNRDTKEETIPSFFLSLEMNQMYNDLNENYYYLAEDLTQYLSSHSYPYYSAEYHFCLNLSGTAHCVSCGDPITDTPDPRFLTCNDCIDGFYCSACGDFIEGEPEYTDSQGNTYCCYCFEEMTECEICHDYFQEENINTYDIVDDEGEHVSFVSICSDCLPSGSNSFPPFGNLYHWEFHADEVSPEGHSILAENYKDFELNNLPAEDYLFNKEGKEELND